MIVDQALYVGGERRPCGDLSDELAALREAGSKGDFLWIGLKDPTQAEFDEVNKELSCTPWPSRTRSTGRQRAKVEVYENSVFVVLKPLRYVEKTSDIETGELMCFVGDRFIVTVRRGEAAPSPGCASGSRPTPRRCGADRWRCCTRSSTPSSTTTR